MSAAEVPEVTAHGWVAVATVAAAFALLATSRFPAHVVLLGAVALLLLLGVLDAPEALGGFSNQGVVTVGVLFVVAAGLRQTGTLAYFLRRVLGRPTTATSAQVRLAGPVLFGSAFLNNTPLVAMLLPVVQDWCRASRIAPSKLMLPLSYFAILGGVTTLIGTSTNLVVNGLLLDSGLPRMGMFGITPVGVPCALVGTAYLIVLGNRLLPDRQGLDRSDVEPRRYAVEMVVADSGPIVGSTLERAGLAHVPGLAVVELWPAQGADPVTQDLSQRTLDAGDRLVFSAVLEAVLDLLRTPGLGAAAEQRRKLGAHAAERCYAEAVISRTSPLVGRTVKEGEFRQLYGAAVIGVSRNGQRLHAPLSDLDFRPGDALFLDARRDLVEKDSTDFSLLTRVEGEGPATSAQAPVAAFIVLAMVVLAATGWLSMLQAAVAGAAGMLATRCCSEETAMRSINWPLLLSIGAAFGLGQALQKTGVAPALGHGLLSLSQGNAWLSLALVYLATAILTEFVTNNAAAIIVLPIAMSTAVGLGANHMPFAIAVTIGASASFATPIGYQTNLMVLGPGGYRFGDFFRLGIPLSLLLWAVTTVVAPLAYPF